jgi:hypothetical protein
MVFAQRLPEGVLKELAALPSMCKFQFAAAEAGLRTYTGPGFGFAHIDSNE